MAQEEKLYVPNEVLQTFKMLFPDIQMAAVTWSWEVPGKIYEAEFQLDEVEYEVEITVTGHWLLTENAVNLDEVPSPLVAQIQATFPEWTIGEIEMIEFSNNVIHYEFELTQGEAEQKVLLREDGWRIF